jgi:hypothetical protein
MKQRTPWLYYLMVWLSAGLFWFAWPFLMARDVNDASRNYFPKLNVMIATYGGIIVLYLALVAYEMHRVATYTLKDGQPFQIASGTYVALMLTLALFPFALPAYLVARTAGFLRVRGRSKLSAFSSVALFICYGISLPVLQGKLNQEWKAQPNSADNADLSRL